MLAKLSISLVLLLSACRVSTSTNGGPPPGSGSPMGPGTGAPAGSGSSAGSGSGTATTEPTTAPKIGEPCAANDVCGEGACVTYYGIAGPRGPAFKSCEIRCDGQGACPGGRKCITVADGPGQVCR